MSVVAAGGLPYLLRLIIGMPYIITTNIDVEDGIVNGAMGVLMYVERNEEDPGKISRLWFHFESDGIGAMLRVKSRPLVYSKPDILQPTWTPIIRRSANVNLKVDVIGVKCKRNQFPVVSGCALTVHKSQGGTYPQIVFQYSKGQEQQLVYVALSRVSSIDGLFLTSTKNEFKFHHAKGCDSDKMRSLRSELQRLSNHRLRTISDELMDTIVNKTVGVVLMSANVQSLAAHALDISTDQVLMTADFLALSETWQADGIVVDIDGYTCISQSIRPGYRAAGVAIYQRNETNAVALPHSIQKFSDIRDTQFGLPADGYGDVCAAEINVMGTLSLLVSVYLTPSTTIKQKKYFLVRNLFMYKYSTMPIIVTGDFNIDVTKPENTEFIDFMKKYLCLTLASDPTQATTLGGTCIDLTFSRNVLAKCKTYCSYFSYHRPILSILTVPAESTHNE